MRSRALLVPLFALACSFVACDLGRLFDRDDPAVEQARHEYDASLHDADADLVTARALLEQVLAFRCEADGGADLVVARPYASLDLGLVVFRVAELLGRRFGDEEEGDPKEDEAVLAARARELDCAHLLLGKVAADPTTKKSVALEARYLLGNFAFLARRYKDAVAYYDQVLLAHPARGKDPAEIGPPDGDDAVARDAAWNRAIALRRLEQQDAGPDAPDASPETPDSDADDSPDGSDGSNDSSDGGPDGGDADGGGSDADGGAEGGTDAASPPPTASAAPSSVTSANLRELDRFKNVPPLDPDLPMKIKERKKLPKSLDK